MSKPILETKGLDEVQEFIRTLPRRVEVIKRYVTKLIADDMAGQVTQRAPSNTLGLPANYPDIEVAAVDDPKNPTFAAIYVGRPTRAGALDPATTVLYPRRYDDRDESPIALAIAALEKLGPFPIDVLPSAIPRDRGYFMFRRARPDEVMALRERVISRRDEIRAVVTGAGFDEEVTPDDIAAYSDVVFEVLRREFGYGGAAQPHWRPAVRAVLRGSTMKHLAGSQALADLLVSPNYHGWVRLGIIGSNVTYGEIESLSRFQNKILG